MLVLCLARKVQANAPSNKMDPKMKKTATLLAILASLSGVSLFAHEMASPAEEAVFIRHGLMMQMADDLAILGHMAKGEADYDAAQASRSANNIAAEASVISMQQFPQGSEVGKVHDSAALPELWTAQEDFLKKATDLGNAASIMQADAGKDAAAIKGAMAQLGGACSACHKAYRQPED